MERALDVLVAPLGRSPGCEILITLQNGQDNITANAHAMFNNGKILKRDAIHGRNILSPETQEEMEHAERSIRTQKGNIARMESRLAALEITQEGTRVRLEQDRISENRMASQDRVRLEQSLTAADDEHEVVCRRLNQTRELRKSHEKDFDIRSSKMASATARLVSILPPELSEFADSTQLNGIGRTTRRYSDKR